MAQQPHGKPQTQTSAAAPAAKGKPGRKPARVFTSPEERFKAIASERTSRALKAIRSLGSLTGKNYAHSQEQRDKIIVALTNEVTRAKERLASGGKGGAPEFTL